MPKVLVTLYPWESPKLYASDFELKKGDKVIIAGEYCNELGIVEDVDIDVKDEPGSKILRIATERDREVYEEHKKEKKEFIKLCKGEVKKGELQMKIIDAMVSLDGKQVLFIFTSDGRVDFRKLVKDLSGTLKKSIRMQQIGSRDEARNLGGYGICGRELCCSRFKGNMQSITTDMARVQQIAHRGAERISGLCGRLMCCLSYEAAQYKQMLEGMPELHSSVNTPEGKGTVIEINAISQEIKVRLEGGKYISLKKEDIK